LRAHWLAKLAEKNLAKSEFGEFTSIEKYKKYHILMSMVCTFFIENDAETLCVHYSWKVPFTNLIHKQSIIVKL